MKSNYTAKSLRSANVVFADPQKIGTTKDRRWATGRNVKGDSPRGRGYYDIFEVWTLKSRLSNGRILVCDTGATREQAERWVKEGAK